MFCGYVLVYSLNVLTTKHSPPPSTPACARSCRRPCLFHSKLPCASPPHRWDASTVDRAGVRGDPLHVSTSVDTRVCGVALINRSGGRPTPTTRPAPTRRTHCTVRVLRPQMFDANPNKNHAEDCGGFFGTYTLDRVSYTRASGALSSLCGPWISQRADRSNARPRRPLTPVDRL